MHLQAIQAAINNSNSTEELISNLCTTLRSYPAVALKESEPILERLFKQSFSTGAKDTGAKIDPGDEHAFEWFKSNPIGFISALGNFGITESSWNVKKLRGKDLSSAKQLALGRATEANYKLQRIVNSDITKAVTLGRILAWIDDPKRDFYNYGWFPMHDGREKDVSLLFERRNPMTYWELRKTFEVDHVIPKMVINRHTGRREAQVSAYNCRCEVARWPKSRRQLVNQGLLSQTA